MSLFFVCYRHLQVCKLPEKYLTISGHFDKQCCPDYQQAQGLLPTHDWL